MLKAQAQKSESENVLEKPQKVYELRLLSHIHAYEYMEYEQIWVYIHIYEGICIGKKKVL